MIRMVEWSCRNDWNTLTRSLPTTFQKSKNWPLEISTELWLSKASVGLIMLQKPKTWYPLNDKLTNEEHLHNFLSRPPVQCVFYRPAKIETFWSAKYTLILLPRDKRYTVEFLMLKYISGQKTTSFVLFIHCQFSILYNLLTCM